MKRWPKNIKEKARRLRKRGLTYSELSLKLNVSKSTLHSWIYDLKRPQYLTREQKLKHLRKIRPLASQALRKKREARLNKIKKRVIKEVGIYNLLDENLLRSILAMLYWAEGAKGRGTLAFANTDSKLALLFITLLRKCHKIDEDKIRARLHLHYYHKIRETRAFWSSLLNIPVSKFGKIYIKPRSKTKKFRKNFAGICFIRYYDENLRYEILERAYALSERIVSNVPIAQLD